MTEKTLEKSENKTCESCGKEFDCGATSEKCWCFEIELNEETSAKLRANFGNCLCRECLLSHESAPINASDFKS